MNRSQSSPLGISAGESAQARRAAGRPTKLDRWLVDQLATRFDTSRVRFALWDQPRQSRKDTLPVTLQFLDRGALYQLLTHPQANFGDLYSTGRIEVNGDLHIVLDEAYRSINQNPKLSRLLARLRAAWMKPDDQQ